METTPKLDREFYLSIARAQGFGAAITQLHLDKEKWEFETFEGQDGYRPDFWKFLEDVRSFSRELWALDLEARAKVTRPGSPFV